MSRRPEIIDAEFRVVREPRAGWLQRNLEPMVVGAFQFAAAIGLMLFAKYALYPLVFGLLG